MPKLNLSKINFAKQGGLIPAIIQDISTSQVLMLGFMNKAALQKTIKTKKVWFYSRTKKRLWQKGEESQNILRVVSLSLDCDRDTILIQALPAGPTCHTGEISCFKTKENPNNIIVTLTKLISERKKKLPANSYTTSLFKAGLNKINKKIVEEATEVVMAATGETKKRLTEESADLIYHLLVLLAARGLSFPDVAEVLIKRHAK